MVCLCRCWLQEVTMEGEQEWTDGGSIAEGLFTTLIALVCVALGLKYVHGEGTKAWRDSYVAVVLLAMVGIQYYHILFAAVQVPSEYKSSRGYGAYRHDCIMSNKGGKRASRHLDVNPCWCKPSRAVCTRITDGTVLNKSTCPPETAECTLYDASGENIQSIHPYLDSRRDCAMGKGAGCTKSQPCTPCDVENLKAFGAARCRTCSDNAKADCNFVEGVGPYCLKSPGSREVIPCTTCCTPKYVNGSLPYDDEGRCIS